jgi:hypothetical protein
MIRANSTLAGAALGQSFHKVNKTIAPAASGFVVSIGSVASPASPGATGRFGIVTSAFFACQRRRPSVGPHEQNQ